jgi:hypothetical protein
MADMNGDKVIGFIASTVETMRDDMNSMRQEMATKADVAILRGDIEQVQLRLDGIEHSMSARFENVEGELSRLRSAVYILGKDRPDVLRLLGTPSGG